METSAGDPMEDPVVGVVVLALVVMAALFVIGLGVIYWGDEYAKPAWSESSVPPATLY